MIQRGGAVVIRMLENVRQVTIRPLIERFIAPGTRVYTDEYDIYHRLPEWGFDHRTVCHSRGEYARDDDGDGFYEVHVKSRRGVLVVVALVVATPSGNLARKTAALPGLLSVRAQRPHPG